MSRELTDKEKKLYTSMVDLPFEPAKFAGDAVVFVTSKNSERNTLLYKKLKANFYQTKERLFLMELIQVTLILLHRSSI